MKLPKANDRYAILVEGEVSLEGTVVEDARDGVPLYVLVTLQPDPEFDEGQDHCSLSALRWNETANRWDIRQ